MDAGAQLLISGYSETAVQDVVDHLAKEGRRITTPLGKVGDKWFAAVDKPEAAGALVEDFGLRQMISGPTREAVEMKVRELQGYGARIVEEIDLIDGTWTAVCEKS